MEECEERRKSVENAMAIMLSATNGPDEVLKKIYFSCATQVNTQDNM